MLFRSLWIANFLWHQVLEDPPALYTGPSEPPTPILPCEKTQLAGKGYPPQPRPCMNSPRCPSPPPAGSDTQGCLGLELSGPVCNRIETMDDLFANIRCFTFRDRRQTGRNRIETRNDHVSNFFLFPTLLWPAETHRINK